MKKMFTLILALAMMTALSVPAFAASGSANVTTIPETTPTTISVTGIYALAPVATTYSVDLEWGAMEFTYTAASKWDPATQTVVEDTTKTGTWTANGNTITVTNKSNAIIGATLSFEKAAGIDVTYSFSEGGRDKINEPINFTLNAATAGNTPSASATFNITAGKITANKNGESLGTITVSLAAPQ